MSSNRRRTWKFLIPLIFYVLLVAFLVFYLRSLDWSKLTKLHVSPQYLVLSTILGLAARFWAAGIWFFILRGLGAELIGFRLQLVYVYAKSWLGRYIPGTAPWILGKIYFASKHGISKHKLAVSSLLEGGLQIVVTMILAFVLLVFDSRLDVISDGIKLLMIGIVVVGIVVLIPPVFNRLVALTYKLFRKQMLPDEPLAGNATVLQAALLYGIFSVVSGLSLFFIAKTVYPALAYHNLAFVVGVTSLASSASMLAIFAPSGLGVREGIQLVLLALIMPKEIALTVTVFSRLWSVVLDFAFYGLAAAIYRLRPAAARGQ